MHFECQADKDAIREEDPQKAIIDGSWLNHMTESPIIV
jgi:hypothetical protein